MTSINSFLSSRASPSSRPREAEPGPSSYCTTITPPSASSTTGPSPAAIAAAAAKSPSLTLAQPVETYAPSDQESNFVSPFVQGVASKHSASAADEKDPRSAAHCKYTGTGAHLLDAESLSTPHHVEPDTVTAAAKDLTSPSSDQKRKRCTDAASHDGAHESRHPKRPRYRLTPRHTLDFSSLPNAASTLPAERDDGPPNLLSTGGRPRPAARFSGSTPPASWIPPKSPLFFSHHRRERPPLPARFSSSEAGGAMLSKVRDEGPGNVTTVKLPRGTFNGSSPPSSRPTSTPGGRASVDRASAPRSTTPDLGTRSPGSHLLAQVGITELLDQDERATFIVDLKNSVNYGAGALRVLFSNTTLRSLPGLLESVNGSADRFNEDVDALAKFGEFKAWVLGSNGDRGTPDMGWSSFAYEGLNWTCSTLRKRLRLIRGTVQLSLADDAERPGLARKTSELVVSPQTKPDTMSPSAMSISSEPFQRRAPISETLDYFGAAVAGGPTSGDLSSGTTNNVAMSPDQTQRKSAAPLGSPRLMVSPLVSPEKTNRVEDLLSTDLGEGSRPSTPHKSSDRGFFDWTRLTPSPALPEHVQFALGVDWAATSLGPIEDWPFALRGMCNLIMASPHPAAMYWGEDLVSIYNEAYIELTGQKHPQLMGAPYREGWVEIWDNVKDVFASAVTTGQATMKDDDCLFMKRQGFLEETYFSWAIIPLVGEDGSVVGLYNPVFEKTRRKIAERRMLTLREVGERIATARQLTSFWGQVVKGLEYNERDAPFALLYSVTDDVESDVSSTQSSSMISNKQCVLESSVGVPEGHPAAHSPLDLKAGLQGFGPYFRDALKADKPVVFGVENGTLPPHLVEGLERRGFDESCKFVVICPIHPTTDEATLGFLVMGINPRRPYDEDYDLFVQLLSRQLATSMASVVLFEEEIKRGQQAANLAARDRFELSEQLAARTQEVEESETKFTRMAEFAPVGMFIANSTGQITYCNDTWYEISRHPRSMNSMNDWIDSVKDEDQGQVREFWRNLVEDKAPTTLEFRFKAPWRGRNDVEGDTWVIGSAYPEKKEDGSLKSIFGSITNISEQKWAEDFQKKRMEEAVELKRQQENFIDITSHEMRNPLSAILQCADEISSSLADFLRKDPSAAPDATLINSSIDAAQTIALCSQHQKRIVDDILTLSKLDSALLLVTPVDVQPISVVQRALKMFEGELETNDIALNFHVTESYKKLDIDWVRLDPSRLLQVLINLTTNAIKFTHTQQSRTIKVSIDASNERPSRQVQPIVSYFPARPRRDDPSSGPDWGTGEEIYISFAIEDTGRGLSENEKKLLFLRFSQASPRTHVQYGGSGLGLFISRELTELQGGEIGVASESGVGSTFAFYVKARRSTAPTDPTEQLLPKQTRKSTNTKSAHKQTSSPGASNERTETSPAHSANPKGYKVLVVEDNIVNQRVLVKQLRNLGCEVEVANHGVEALDYLRETNFWRNHQDSGKDLNVILMDLEMPIMSGLDCSRQIRELQRSGEIVRHVPIIAVTANARPEQIHIAIEAGMDDVIPKPFRIPELLPKLVELSERHGV